MPSVTQRSEGIFFMNQHPERGKLKKIVFCVSAHLRHLYQKALYKEVIIYC